MYVCERVHEATTQKSNNNHSFAAVICDDGCCVSQPCTVRNFKRSLYVIFVCSFFASYKEGKHRVFIFSFPNKIVTSPWWLFETQTCSQPFHESFYLSQWMELFQFLDFQGIVCKVQFQYNTDTFCGFLWTRVNNIPLMFTHELFKYISLSKMCASKTSHHENMSGCKTWLCIAQKTSPRVAVIK